ncbi:GNAT family N-acetyltransferase [Agarivorans sp. DSG3-1]|uniref:GNAT family N-acetyltransferase n=1 Tax=Agarivorans sp. DSG3-1 TaxID=3342249 RepID=UPI00398F679C
MPASIAGFVHFKPAISSPTAFTLKPYLTPSHPNKSFMTTQLKQANASDAEQLQTIAIQAFSEDAEQYGAYPLGIESLPWHLEQVAKGHYYTIEYNGKLAGGMLTVPLSYSEMEINYFFISDSFQNKQIGSAAMALIEQCYPTISVWHLVTPYKAFRNQHFYQKLGYKKVGEMQPRPNDPFTLFEYKKVL